jgi:hypothetical protein
MPIGGLPSIPAPANLTYSDIETRVMNDTNGALYRHPFVYNRNAHSILGLGRLFRRNLNDVGVVTALAISLPISWEAGATKIEGAPRLPISRVSDTSRRARLCMGLYFLATMAVSVSAGKADAAINFLEWSVALVGATNHYAAWRRGHVR